MPAAFAGARSAAPRLPPLAPCLLWLSAGATAEAGASASGLPRGCQTWKPARTCSHASSTVIYIPSKSVISHLEAWCMHML